MPVPPRSGSPAATPAVRRGDRTAARAWAERAVADDTGALRQQVAALAGEIALVQLDDAALVDRVAAAVERGALPVGGGAPPALMPLARRQAAPAPAPAPAASSSASPARAPAPAEAAVETTFGSNLDVAAMVAVLQQAARDGAPFCEACERARRERAQAAS